MLLEEKIKIMLEKNYLKEKLSKYYFFLFFSIFLFIINIFMILFLYDKSQRIFKEFNLSKFTSNQKSYILLWIWFFAFGYFEIMWFVNSLATIYLNRYYNFNIFRSLKWLKIKLFTSFKFTTWKQIKQSIDKLKQEENDFIRTMQSNGFILHGSKSISYKYQDYWRTTNDLDFMSMSINSSLENLNKIKEIKFNFKDNVTAKLELNQKNIEVLIAKFIPKKYIENKKDIKIPNIYWMIAMKIHQLFRFYLMKNKELSVSNQKIQNTLLDLDFLLSKTNNWNINKIMNAMESLYLSNFFISYWIDTYCFDFSKNDEIEKLSNYLKEKIKKNQAGDELLFFFEEIFDKVKNKKYLVKMSNKINNIVKNKEELESKFIDASSHNEKEISSLKRIFLTKLEKNNFIEKQYKNANIENNIMKQFFKEIVVAKNKENEIDIRQILLLELNKQMKEEINE